MKNKWNNPDELEFKVDNISLLSKTREKHVKELHIKLDIENINKNLIDEIKIIYLSLPFLFLLETIS